MTLNHYAYAGANPVNNVDPTGHDSLGEQIASIGIQGALVSLGAGAVVGAIFHVQGGNFFEGLFVGTVAGFSLVSANAQGRLGEAVFYGTAQGLANVFADALVQWYSIHKNAGAGFDPLLVAKNFSFGSGTFQSFIRGFSGGASSVAFDASNEFLGAITSGLNTGISSLINQVGSAGWSWQGAGKALLDGCASALISLVIKQALKNGLGNDVADDIIHNAEAWKEATVVALTGGFLSGLVEDVIRFVKS